jgi:hypothetical protein
MVVDALLVTSALLVAVTTALPAAVPVKVAVVAVCALSVPVPVTDHVTP